MHVSAVRRAASHLSLKFMRQPIMALVPAQVKLHPWFAGLDWASLARQKAAFVPTLEHEYDTSYFAIKPVRIFAGYCLSSTVDG